MKKAVLYLFISFLSLGLSLEASGQLLAGFRTTDFAGNVLTDGCSPLLIQFIDTSTNNGNPIPRVTSPYNSHQWFFDDGTPQSTSTVKSPVFGFTDPGTYNVMLVVTNNAGNRDTVIHPITVFEDPVVDIGSDVTSGCNPLDVCFYDSSTSAGDSIVSWLWDFGDGVLSSAKNPCHRFRIISGQNCFTITLRVENANGCVEARTFRNYICIDLPPEADFEAFDTVICDTPYTANFIDLSNTPNPSTYFWDFGDSTTSTDQNPSHVYDTSGVYTVKLVVTDTVCNEKDSIIKLNYITMQDLFAEFSVNNTTICQNSSVAFADQSYGGPDSWFWDFGDARTSTSKNPSHTYRNPGTYTVMLVITGAQGCADTVVKHDLIVVNPVPAADFYSDSTYSCRAPFTVTFNDISSGGTGGIVSWDWSFGDGNHSSDQYPSHTYNSPADYTVTLTVEDSLGCSNTIFKSGFVSIDPMTVAFAMDTSEGCAPLKVDFRDQSSAIPAITGWEWDFGDGTPHSFGQNPPHTYINPDAYTVTLTASNGACTGTVTGEVTVGELGPPNFLPDSFAVCVDQEVTFTNLTIDTTGNLLYSWDFNGDGGYEIQGDQSTDPVTFSYDQPGTYSVTLRVGYAGCFADTSIDIEVLEPEADFDFTQNCAMPDQVVFQDQSSSVTDWKWYFGDGDSSDVQSPTHTYDTSGTFTVRLVVMNDTTGCSAEKEQDVTVSVTVADFTVTPVSACAGDTIYFSNNSSGTLTGYQWDFGDGSNISGSKNPSHVYSGPGQYSVSLTVTDVNGCTATKSKANYIEISAVTSDFMASTRTGCMPDVPGAFVAVSFTDLSTTTPSPPTNITQWEWDFGDGSTPSTVPNPTHNYTADGTYDISLKVTNDRGCEAIRTKQNHIDISQPHAAFDLDFNLYCTNNPVPFINRSRGTNYTSYWEFGDGKTSTSRNPVHIYDSSGTYDVKLVIEDQYGCMDSITVTNALTTDIPLTGFEADDTSSVCPPHVACFDYFSSFDTIQIDYILWLFGDGGIAENIDSPCHIYNEAGVFPVTVYVELENYCVDSITLTNYISVGGATGDISIEPDTGCVPLDALLDANSVGAISHFWFFGDNELNPKTALGPDTIAVNYINPGIFQPWVVLTDTQNPPCSWTLYSDDLVYVDSVYADFGSDLDTVCRDAPVQFTDSSTALIDTNYSNWTWLWDFGDSTTDTVRNPIHHYSTPGLYTVTLSVINGFGCGGTVQKDVYVRDRPTAAFTTDSTEGCDLVTVDFTNQSMPGVGGTITDYFWNFGDTLLTDDTVHLSDPSYSYGVGGYNPTMIITDNNGCTDTASTTVQVYRSPAGIFNSDTVNICLKDTIQLQADTGFVSYSWTPPKGLSATTISDPRAYPFDTTNYSVFIEEIHGCNITDSVLVNVVPLPPLTVTPYPDTAICPGDTVHLVAVGGDIYNWVPTGYLNNPRLADPLAYPPATTDYTVINWDTISGCQNRYTVKVIVNILTASFEGENQCLGIPSDFVDISYGNELPIISWSWDFGDTTTNADVSSVQHPSYQYPAEGNYDVRLVIEDAIGCVDTVFHRVTIDSPPNPMARMDTTICFGESVRLFSSGGDTVYWSPDYFIDDRFSANPTVTPAISTTYYAHWAQGVCPFDSAGVLVEVIPTPVLETIEDSTILRGTSIELVTFSDRYDSIWWMPPDSLSCSDCLSPVATPYDDIRYVVRVIDEYGCTNSDAVSIQVEVACNDDQVFVASGFTPNGDGINDEVYARLRGVKKLNYFRVYDRWGQLIFETDNENEGWNGRDQDGEKLNSGVYVYVVEAVCHFENTIVRTGNITLIK